VLLLLGERYDGLLSPVTNGGWWRGIFVFWPGVLLWIFLIVVAPLLCFFF